MPYVTDRVMCRVLLVWVWIVVIAGPAAAQSGPSSFGNSSRPTVGSAGGMSIPQPLPGIAASGTSDILRHRDFTGRPCLDVTGYARPQIIDRKLYDHVIVVKNSCPQRIEIKVCYYQSQDCIPMRIPGNDTRDSILGMMPAIKSFRFEFKEKF